jgi:hypothetical protein
VARKGHDTLFARYGVAGQATYVFRPDGHVLARCTGIDAAFAASAIERVLVFRPSEPAKAAVSVQPEADRLFDALSKQLDAMPAAARAPALARVVERIERARGNLAGIAGA